MIEPATDEAIRAAYERSYTGSNRTSLSWSAFRGGYRACEREQATVQGDPLRQAAEQFLASARDGNVSELIDYYEEIFREALGGDGDSSAQVSEPARSQKLAAAGFTPRKTGKTAGGLMREDGDVQQALEKIETALRFLRNGITPTGDEGVEYMVALRTLREAFGAKGRP